MLIRALGSADPIVTPAAGQPTGPPRDTVADGLPLVPSLSAVVVFVALLLLAFAYVRWLLRGLYEIEAAARRMREGEVMVRLPVPRGPAPLRGLAETLNALPAAMLDAVERESAFVVDAAHQLRNPLTVLNLRIELLVASLTGPAASEAELIREEIVGLEHMLGQLLELAATRHSLAEHPEPVDAEELVSDRINTWRWQAERRSITLDLEPGQGTLVQVQAPLAGSILDAVLDNAIKFSPDGGQVTVRVLDDPPMTCVEVSDEGPGLAPADFARIGERFWRGSAARRLPGSGLGLSIARELAAAMGGRLTFAAAEPHGLRVSLRMPQAETVFAQHHFRPRFCRRCGARNW